MPPTTTSGMSLSPSLSPSPSSSSSTSPSSSLYTTFPSWTTTFDSGYPTPVSQTSGPSPTATDSPPSQGAFGPGGVPVATIFYFVAFVSGLVAIIYTIHRIRSNRRRRLQEQNGDSESGGRTRHTATYRPEDDEGCPPPQYRAYAADEPSLDPEMTIIYPDQAHYASSHLGLLSFTPALSSPSVNDDDSVNAYLASSRPALQTNSTGTTTTTTTTITTTSTTTAAAPGSSTGSPSASPTIIQRSIMAPNANILTTTPLNSADRLDQYSQHQNQNQNQEQQQGDHMSSVPVISAPSPAFTFTVSRHLPILRNGLAGSNNIHQSGSGRRTSTPPVSNSTTVTGTGGTASTNNRLSTPDMQSVSQINAPNRNSFAGSISSIGSGSTSQSGLLVAVPQQQQHPVLNRLRSQGPPPYIPVAPEAALPRLPPEYDTAIAPATTPSTTTATTPGSL